MFCIRESVLYFIAFCNLSRSIKRMKKSALNQRTVYNFTSLTRMKFKSPTKGNDSEIQNPSVLSKIKSFSWLNGGKKTEQKSSQIFNQTDPDAFSKTISNASPLQFIKKLTNDHFLVGNQYKIDVIGLGSIVDDFIDTEYIWSLKFKKPISNIAIDTKKCLLAFLVGSQVEVYGYNIKKSREPPSIMTIVKTSGQVKFIQFAKDSHLSLFYEKSMQIYNIDQTLKTAKKIYVKSYNQPEKASVFQVPQAFQGVINIFFEQLNEDTGLFQLLNLQVRMQREQIKMSSIMKIYNISGRQRAKIVITNYSKQIYCMNLGHQILAVKKGYIIDTVNSNIDSDGAVLRYLGNDRLIHVTTNKIQIYRFCITTNLNPPRIILESTDSIYSQMNDQNYIYVEVLEMLSDNLVVFYQIKQDKNNSLSGQIKYAFCLTQKVKFQEKIRQILPSSEELQKFKSNPDKSISDRDYQIIEEKCDMAMKMGLTRKQIYLKLWNNSTKCDIADFQFLLDSMDYELIRSEIQTKLKKKSMALRQVIKIQQGCLGMLQKTTFSPQVTQQSFRDFLISHFLLRKLKLYQMFFLIQKAENDLKKSQATAPDNNSTTLMINIKDYIYYSKCDLKAILLDLIRDFCFNQKDRVLKIRILTKQFRFSFRPIYSQLLQDIIKEAGPKLSQLLQAIPQILPYEHTFAQQPEDTALYQGIWGKILPQQWELNLYAGGISTIYNKQHVEEVVKSVWAKRFFLSLHDIVPYSKTQILEIHQKNKAEQTFYSFIEKVFATISDRKVLEDLVSFIETKYLKLPQHLVGQIFLYKSLYDYLKRQNALKSRLAKGQFNQFLKLKDFQICKFIFDLQKVKKNCILKDVKQDIYNAPQINSGNDIFNLALLNFFSSELSQISDIKYLLNRLNNLKYEFHSINQGMYEVIVKGMQAKLYLGSEHDIPIDEVYIYISNIHIEEDSQIKKDLKYLDIVNRYSQKFRKIKLNMSVFQIIRQAEKVLSITVKFQIQDCKMVQKTDKNDILQSALKILGTIQTIKNDIYFESELKQELIVFIFITRLLECQNFIQKTSQLLQSAQLQQKYRINELFIENAILFLYKQKFSADKIYINNKKYFQKLLTLLPEQNKTRTFISYEIELGVTLSCDGNLIEYPLGGINGVLSTVELQTAIILLPGAAIKKINFERIYQISLKMQQISSDGQISSISLYQIYEIVTLRLLQCKLIKDSIPMIRKIFQINPQSSYHFVYPVLIVKKIASQLCDQNRALLLLILTYQYKNAGQLLDLVQKLLNSKLTSLEQKVTLKAEYQRIKGTRPIFNRQNQIFDGDYMQSIASEQQQNAFSSILAKSLMKMLQFQEQFLRNPQYYILYTILCNNPYAIVKYLYCSRYESNFKAIRCFFSHLIKQEVFNSGLILQLGKRTFKILHEGLSQTVYIEDIIEKYKETSLKISIDVSKIKPNCNLSIVMSKSIQRFRNKIKQNMISQKKKQQQSPEQKRMRVKQKLNRQKSQIQEIPIDYPFQDSDNELPKPEPRLKKIMTNQSTKVNFDQIFQRQLLINRQQKALGLYLSQQFSTREKQMFYSRKNDLLQIKNSVIKLKNKKKELDQGHSMRLSERHTATVSYSFQDPIDTGKQQNGNAKKSLKSSISIQLTESFKGEDIQEKNEEEQKPLKMQKPVVNYGLIIDKIVTQSEGQNYNISSINETSFDIIQFQALIVEIYESQKLTVGQSLGIIKKINERPNQMTINSDYLQIYIKMEHFQKKFNLDIDLKKMFPIQGTFLESKSLNDLFNFVKDLTKQCLTDNNVYKITKVMSLVFKNNDIEQQLNISFLIKLLRKYEINQISDPKQVSMQKQKIKAFTEKISINELNSKDQDILNPLSDVQFKVFMIETIFQAMKKRKNQSMAGNFLKKWKS